MPRRLVSLVLGLGLSILCVACTRVLERPSAAPTRGATESPRPESTASASKSLRVGLYPYVPRVEQFANAIRRTWSQRQPRVSLEFVDWTGGYEGDPAGMDVFVFDAVFLDDFRERDYLARLAPDEVDGRDDFLDFAIEGVHDRGSYSAIPMLACTHLLFYAEGDAPLAAAKTLSAVTEVLAQCSYTSQRPSATRGLMLDMQGGTTNACLYAALARGDSGPESSAASVMRSDLDPAAIGRMRALLARSSFLGATQEPSNGQYGRTTWLSQGYGRAAMGFPESLSATNAEDREKLRFALFPFGDDPSASPLFYADVIAVSRTTRERALAIELANLMASTEVLVASLRSEAGAPPQYLLPTRRSAFRSLAQHDPTYARLWQIVRRSDPTLFNLGSDARSWIESMQDPIKTRSRMEYPCGCTQAVGALASHSEAEATCPTACRELGGWSGLWSASAANEHGAPSAACRCNACSAPSPLKDN